MVLVCQVLMELTFLLSRGECCNRQACKQSLLADVDLEICDVVAQCCCAYYSLALNAMELVPHWSAFSDHTAHKEAASRLHLGQLVRLL